MMELILEFVWVLILFGTLMMIYRLNKYVVTLEQAVAELQRLISFNSQKVVESELVIRRLVTVVISTIIEEEETQAKIEENIYSGLQQKSAEASIQSQADGSVVERGQRQGPSS